MLVAVLARVQGLTENDGAGSCDIDDTGLRGSLCQFGSVRRDCRRRHAPTHDAHCCNACVNHLFLLVSNLNAYCAPILNTYGVVFDTVCRDLVLADHA